MVVYSGQNAAYIYLYLRHSKVLTGSKGLLAIERNCDLATVRRADIGKPAGIETDCLSKPENRPL